ncbi:hypothetical protein EGM85_11290 [Macrococcus caseolyticus]|nr:hypothetical protein [Macrococcus caseolyticus]RKO11952.1 hypothetical protein D6861_11290 [Macrococcus caseolyticus]
MFFAKLLNKIPFFRNRRIKKLKRELAEVNKDFTDGFFNDKYIISIHNILNTSLIAFSDDLVANSTEKLSLYSKTSMNALRLLDKKIFKKSILERSPLLSLTLTPNYFTSWYSNEESVVMLVGIMKEYIAANVLRIQSSL